MNQQKIYQKHRKTHGFLGKKLSFLIILVLFFSILSNIIIPITTAAPLALNNDDPKTQTKVEPKDTDTKTSTPSTESKTEPTVEPTKTTSTPTSSEDDSQTKTSSSSSSDNSNTDTKSTTTTSTIKTIDDSISIDKNSSEQKNNTDITTITKNEEESSISSPNQINKSTYDITLIDKTNNIQKNDSTVKSNNMTKPPTLNLYQEGEIGDISKEDQVTVKTSIKDDNKPVIKEINFTASTNQKNVRVTLSEYDEEPEEVTNNLSVSPSKKVYKFIDVKLTANETYIGETGIETMIFTFTVEKDWIETNNLDKETIEMMRYHNNYKK